MHFVLRRKLCQSFLVFQEFLDNFGLEGRCILLSHHALVYLISALFPVQILGSIILRKQICNETAFLDEIYPQVENEVKSQLDYMLALEDREDPNFSDTDYQLASYAAALRILTKYKSIED